VPAGLVKKGEIMISKPLVLILLLFGALGLNAQQFSNGQCDRQALSPIKCGYFEEGYIDGANDARAGLDNDHKRYRSKFEKQYESFYRQGYDSGYAGVKPLARWSDDQKNAYDQGFDDGEDDRNRSIARLPARYEGQYDVTFKAYYRRGYTDGYDNRQRRYDFPVERRGEVPGGFPGRRPGRRRGTATGTLLWNGRVDNVVHIVLRGGDVSEERIAGPLSRNNHRLSGILPRRPSVVSVNKLDGRGRARVIQQPSRTNDYTAIVEVFDRRRGADNYRLNISWTSTNRREAYQSGKLTWRGRVDQTANIVIFGDDVSSFDVSGSGLSDVSFNLEGYLSARPGRISVRKRNGRGTVSVIEQPSAGNDFTAVIQIFDPRGGDDEYEVEVTW